MQFISIPTIKKRAAALAALIAIGALSANSYAIDPFTLENIKVEGLQHVDAGSVFVSLPFRVGDVYDDEKGTLAIQALYATKLFNDVSLSASDGVLTIIVRERPAITSLNFTGAKAINSDMLLNALRSVGISEGRPYDRALADQAEQEIKRQYLSSGYYSATVDVIATPIENNRVSISFIITEGDIAKINEIRIIGNNDYSNSRLLGEMSLSEGNWLSWYTRSNRYSREKLNADLEKIRSFYLNRGYLDFSINSTQVEITPDKKHIAIIIDITEGHQYILSSVEIQGDYLGRENEFKALINLDIGKPYNASDVSALTKLFTAKFGSYGYAFAQVQMVPEIDRENGTVKLVIISRPQRRVYVRHVNIRGNERTRDEVIRREFRQLESAWYDWDKIQLSRDRVDRLGYFTEVDIDTSPVPNTDDQVDVTLTVREKPTGNLQLGAGFSSDDKLSVNFGISQENIFGSGQYLGINISNSKYNRQFYFSTLDPYFTQDGISRGFDVYYTSRRPFSSSSSNDYYSVRTAGASIRFGVPFTEVDRVYFGFGAEMTRIKPGRELPSFYESYIKEYGERSTYFPFTVSWSRDTRDSSLVPSTGTLQVARGELSLLGDSHYFKTTYQYQHWLSFSGFTLGMNGQIGYGDGIGNKFPVFKNFFGGGLNFVRGFRAGTFGEYDAATDTYSGGTHSYNFNIELYSPLPGSGGDRTMRLSTFFDYGNVTTEDQGWRFGDARMSVGVGFSWISPLGPLKFSYAIPIRSDDDDELERFQFSIGTSF